MAVQDTSRFGLKTYSSGADFHPTREDFNERMELLDELAAVALQGTHSARPLAAIRGRFWWSTDRRELSWDTGRTWEEVAPLGASGGAQTLSIVDAGASTSGAEGTSRRAARADHVHAIPLASASSHGAMPSQDKALLNTASSNASGSSLMRRDGGGRASVATPTQGDHATPRSYVDTQVGTRAPSSHTHNADHINAGVLNAARLPAATSTQQGALSASDKAKLDSASFNGGPGSLVSRDVLTGRVQFVDPAQDADAATAGWVRANTMRDHGNTGNANLNGLLEPGYWHCDDSGATSGRNYPVVGSGGALQVLNTGAGHRKQNYYRRASDAMYTRRYAGGAGVWSDWKLAYS